MPELGAVKRVTLSKLRQFYRQHSSPLTSEQIAQRFAEIRGAVELTVDEATRKAPAMFVCAVAGQIRSVTKSIHEYDRRIAMLFAEHEDARVLRGQTCTRCQTIFRSLAYRWIGIMFACWKSRQPYDEMRYVEQLRRRGSPLIEKIAA